MTAPDQTAHLIAVASTGFTLGLVHVLAGPDHLSALAALAVGTSWKAFILGFRWGIGHSTGLVVVAIIFIALKGDLDLRTLGRYCDSLVGLFMIGLGCYGVLGALKVFREKKAKRDPDWELSGDMDGAGLEHTRKGSPVHGTNMNSDVDDLQGCSTAGTDIERGSASYLDGSAHLPRSGDVVVKTKSTPTHDDGHYHHFGLSEMCPFIPNIDMHDATTQKVISFSIGLLHGVAGPGAILGVLPAVEMQNWRYSFVYLGAFILSSTVSMGSFAALYGEVTRRLGATAESVELALSVFSAAMSIIVGTTWLVLSILGKLEGLFH